tara:strand:- start:1261 stop:1428 length:168 start_codon:yes stop_codon:yes gene_type:complete
MDEYNMLASVEFIDTALVGIINNTPQSNEHFSTLLDILSEIDSMHDALINNIEGN